MSKPSILIVPGSFSLSEFYSDVVNAVAAKGYEIKALHLPSCGLKSGPQEGTPPTMYDDAALIAKETAALVDSGKDVILVAHSYGGTPATESVKGLAKVERQKQGKTGGVVRLAYLTALVPAVGDASGAVLADVPKENLNPMGIDDKGWLYFTDDQVAVWAANTYNDLPKEEGEALIKRFPRHSAASFGGELTYAGYNDVPVSYLFCEKDMVIPPKNQRDVIELIERESGKKVAVTSIKTGHCPTASAPQKVVDWIVHAAAQHE